MQSKYNIVQDNILMSLGGY